MRVRFGGLEPLSERRISKNLKVALRMICDNYVSRLPGEEATVPGGSGRLTHGEVSIQVSPHPESVPANTMI